MQASGTPQRFDIIVVGAGMVGAALALGLGRQGWHVALVEKAAPAAVAAEAAPDLRVSAINCHSEALLRQLGAWSAIENSRLAPFTQLSVWEALTTPRFGGGRPFNELRFEAQALGQAQFGHIVENSVTQWALWEQIQAQPRIHCFCPAGLAALDQLENSVEIELDDGQRLLATLLVGADGAASKVRDLANIGIRREQYDQQALVASVVHEGPPENATWQAFTPSGPRAYLPLPVIDGQSWASLVWYDSPARIAELRQLPEAEFIKAVQAAFPQRLPALISAPARASFPLAKMQAQDYFRGRVALIGDAAHTINPLAGQGVNLGFDDVDCLLELLGQVQDQTLPQALLEDLLGRYQGRRRPASQRMAWLMDLFYYTFSNRRLPLRLARNLGLVAGQHLPLGKSVVARYAMGITPLPDSFNPRELLARLPLPPGPGQLLARLRPRKSPIKSSS